MGTDREYFRLEVGTARRQAARPALFEPTRAAIPPPSTESLCSVRNSRIVGLKARLAESSDQRGDAELLSFGLLLSLLGADPLLLGFLTFLFGSLLGLLDLVLGLLFGLLSADPFLLGLALGLLGLPTGLLGLDPLGFGFYRCLLGSVAGLLVPVEEPLGGPCPTLR